MSFTEFMNRAQVNNHSAYNYYPVHSFGRLAPSDNEIVTKQVIPYLAKELKQAVKDEDSQKIQVRSHLRNIMFYCYMLFNI